MGCRVALDQYLIQLAGSEDLIIKELDRTLNSRPLQPSKISRLGSMVNGVSLLLDHLSNKKEDFINQCISQSKSEDEECVLMYKTLKNYISDDLKGEISNIMDLAINGVDIVEGQLIALNNYLNDKSIAQYVKECKRIQEKEK